MLVGAAHAQGPNSPVWGSAAACFAWGGAGRGVGDAGALGGAGGTWATGAGSDVGRRARPRGGEGRGAGVETMAAGRQVRTTGVGRSATPRVGAPALACA